MHNEIKVNTLFILSCSRRGTLWLNKIVVMKEKTSYLCTVIVCVCECVGLCVWWDGVCVCVCVCTVVVFVCVCVLTVTGGSILCTLLSSISISLALAQRFFTSFSLIISHRRNCSICLYGNYTICSMINQCNVL